ncbi:MAG: hypothetical protein GPJ54_07655 [Candidatus Heimdallarchaeota archaeon]|nr:hypothetical protein [Candidatus Heimdallarchaeota archaeon]
MTEIVHFSYESNAPIETSDNYFLQIKAHVEYNGENSEKLQSAINSTSIKFFRSVSLFDALMLLEDNEGDICKNYYKSVRDNLSENQLEVAKFMLTTLDAVQISGKEDKIKFEINPELEGKKKKKGLLGKLFGKN